MDYGFDYTFFEDNYILIIVIAVVILMTIIGFIADKKDFGKKKNTSSSKKKTENLETEEVSDDNQQVLLEESQLDNFASATNDAIENDIATDFTSDNYEESSMNEEINVPVQEETTNDSLEWNEPVPVDINMEQSVEESNLDENDQYKIDNTYDDLEPSELQELDPVQNDINQPDDNQIEVSESENLNEEFEMPNIDEVSEEIDETDDDEDIWKF